MPLLLLGNAFPECNLTSGHAQTPLCTPGLAGRLAYTHTQKEHGHLCQGQMKMAFGSPTIGLGCLHHCLCPLLRRARRGLHCPWGSRMTLWRADYSLCAAKKMFDCHSFPHSGSVKLALWPVAGAHIAEPVIAGDFSGRPEFSWKQGFPSSKLYRTVVALEPSRAPFGAGRVPSTALLLTLIPPTCPSPTPTPKS